VNAATRSNGVPFGGRRESTSKALARSRRERVALILDARQRSAVRTNPTTTTTPKEIA